MHPEQLVDKEREMLPSAEEKKKQSLPSPRSEEEAIYEYVPSPRRPSPEQRRWAGLSTAIFWISVLLVVVIAFVVWNLFLR